MPAPPEEVLARVESSNVFIRGGNAAGEKSADDGYQLTQLGEQLPNPYSPENIRESWNKLYP